MLIRSLLALVLLPLSLFFAPGTQAPNQEPAPAQLAREDPEQFIFYAVLEGLYRDGVSNEIVDALMTQDAETRMPHYFIYACPICMPSWNAFATYRKRPEFIGDKKARDTFGSGLDEAATSRLLEGSREARMTAVRDLVRRWMEERLQRHRLTPQELERYQIEFEDMRKIGMTYLKAYRKDPKLAHIYAEVSFCPFCDAACEAPPK